MEGIKVATLVVRLVMVLNPVMAEEQPSLVTLSRVSNNYVCLTIVL